MIDVDKMLKNYHDSKRSLSLLEFKIENYERYKISAERTIEEMTYTSSQGERVSNSAVSDKTARIALNYQSTTEANNEEHLAELEERYEAQKYVLDMLEFCIFSLKKELSDIMTDMFINEMDYAQLGNKYNLSRTSINRYRKKGISELIEMFNEVMNQKTG